MAEFIRVCSTSDLSPGTMKRFPPGDYEVVVVNVGGTYYVLDNHCPHMGGELSAGKLEGTVITCPRHGSQFDVKDGTVIRWAQMGPVVSTVSRMLKPPRPVYAFKVKIEGNQVFVEKPPPLD